MASKTKTKPAVMSAPAPASELNCFQRRNPFAGFIKEHSGDCFLDRDETHEKATHHVNIGYHCCNVCRACAERTTGKGEKKRRVYPAEQVQHGTHRVISATNGFHKIRAPRKGGGG